MSETNQMQAFEQGELEASVKEISIEELRRTREKLSGFKLITGNEDFVDAACPNIDCLTYGRFIRGRIQEWDNGDSWVNYTCWKCGSTYSHRTLNEKTQEMIRCIGHTAEIIEVYKQQ